MTTNIYIYRGVTYTKDQDGNQNVLTDVRRNRDKIEKVYRAAKYFTLPKVKHVVSEHLYRGVKYAS